MRALSITVVERLLRVCWLLAAYAMNEKHLAKDEPMVEPYCHALAAQSPPLHLSICSANIQIKVAAKWAEEKQKQCEKQNTSCSIDTLYTSIDGVLYYVFYILYSIFFIQYSLFSLYLFSSFCSLHSSVYLLSSVISLVSSLFTLLPSLFYLLSSLLYLLSLLFCIPFSVSPFSLSLHSPFFSYLSSFTSPLS